MSELVIENISYRYKNADRLALNDVSCAFKPGQVAAVVGPSGIYAFLFFDLQHFKGILPRDHGGADGSSNDASYQIQRYAECCSRSDAHQQIRTRCAYVD